MTGAAMLFALLAGLLAAWLLRRAWRDRTRDARGLVAGGWALLLATPLAGALAAGPALGAAAAIVALSVGALLVIAEGRVVRAGRAPKETTAPEPLGGHSRWRRGVIRVLLAGPLGLAAAIGVASAYASLMPGDPRTRVLVGGLMIPVVWAVMMAWTLADQRLPRALAVVAGTSLAGFALAAARGLH